MRAADQQPDGAARQLSAAARQAPAGVRGVQPRAQAHQGSHEPLPPRYVADPKIPQILQKVNGTKIRSNQRQPDGWVGRSAVRPGTFLPFFIALWLHEQRLDPWP